VVFVRVCVWCGVVCFYVCVEFLVFVYVCAGYVCCGMVCVYVCGCRMCVRVCGMCVDCVCVCECVLWFVCKFGVCVRLYLCVVCVYE